MRAFSRIIIFVALILATVSWVNPSISSAEYVWVYSQGKDTDVYLNTDKILVAQSEPRYQGLVNFVSRKNGNVVNFYPFGFDIRNG